MWVKHKYIDLTIHPIKDGKKLGKWDLTHVYLRPKEAHVDLATDSTEEETHLTTEVMKGKSVRNIYEAKIRLTPTMVIEQSYQTKDKISRYKTQHSHTWLS